MTNARPIPIDRLSPTEPQARLGALAMPERLNRIDELLEARYATASLGNHSDPLDELIYVVLSIQTGPAAYQRVFEELKRNFSTWDELATISETDLQAILKPAGLSKQKARSLRGIVFAIAAECERRARGRQVRANLNFLRQATDQEAERFLTSLPGVSTKTARCVLMYSLGRPVFPVDSHVLRVLKRLGIAEPELHRKRACDPIQERVPEKMRHRLHVNLIHHGRAVCKPTNPTCGQCPLVSFCEDGIKRLSQTPRLRPTIDLFAGPGGLSAGFRRAGYTVVFAAEKDRHAAQTYRHNHPGVPTFEVDIGHLSGQNVLDTVGLNRGDINVVLGGPPCQGYSQAGKRNPAHPDNRLYREFVRIGRDVGSRLLVMENVPGIQNVRGQTFISEIEATFRAHEFEPRHFLLNAAEYGVPQRRKRILFVGLAETEEFAAQVSAPTTTHVDGPLTSSGPPLPTARVVRDALAGLPRRRAGEGREVACWQGEALYNHVAMSHSTDVIARIRSIPVGGGAISYRRLQGAEPARTVIAGHRALPVHPRQHRTITVREAARLQGFEDSFRFLGPRAEQPLQVANAVPPPLGLAIALNLLSYLGSPDGVNGAVAPLPNAVCRKDVRSIRHRDGEPQRVN